jgi:hypothetical protein
MLVSNITIPKPVLANIKWFYIKLPENQTSNTKVKTPKKQIQYSKQKKKPIRHQSSVNSNPSIFQSITLKTNSNLGLPTLWSSKRTLAKKVNFYRDIICGWPLKWWKPLRPNLIEKFTSHGQPKSVQGPNSCQTVMSRDKIETFSADLVAFSMKYAYTRGVTQMSIKGRRLPMADLYDIYFSISGS